MKFQHSLVGGVASCLLVGGAWPLLAQQVTIGAPFQNFNDNFHEQVGVGWNFGLNTPPPVGFNNDGGPGAIVGLGLNGQPQQGINFGFGGPNPPGVPIPGNPAAPVGQLGWQVQGNGFRAGFNVFAGQGSSRSNVSQTPMITTLNGYPGYFSATTQRPFVTSVIPVVGGYGSGFVQPVVVYPSGQIPWPTGGGQAVSPIAAKLERLRAELAAGIPPGDDPSVGRPSRVGEQEPEPQPTPPPRPPMQDPPLILRRADAER
ncbi:MAG: hypothetical protein SFX18_00585 [Pirellulales bacterium]|nr:hypothetical protein [Pirellulales bacterium]